MNVIAVGSSFSQDATRYLHQIAKPDNVYHKVFNQYIGCCSIERCWYNAENDVAGYELEVNGKKTVGIGCFGFCNFRAGKPSKY